MRSLQRTIKGEDDLLESLRGLEKETFENGAKVLVRDVDYNLLTFEDQIKIDLQADIMVRFAYFMSNVAISDLDWPSRGRADALAVHAGPRSPDRAVRRGLLCESPLPQHGVVVWAHV